MANLTKEYFDKELRVTKADIVGQLSTHIDKEVADLAGITKRHFDRLEQKLDVKEEVEKLKVQMKQVREALSL
jgi:hypothetical protein